jgi:transcriptional regulator with XRE-family HTH domain
MTTRRAVNGAAVKALREALGMRQDEMASRLGISGPYLANIEAGRKQPRAYLQSRVAEVLGVPITAVTYPVTGDADPVTDGTDDREAA